MVEERQLENIQIKKNSKGYNYEFRVLSLDVEAVKKKIIEINEMLKTFKK